MTVVFTRLITPNSGHLDDTLKFLKERKAALEKTYGIDISLNARFGGPVGQFSMVSYHDNMSELEDLRRKVMRDVAEGVIPQPKAGLIKEAEDAIWIRL